MVEPMEDKPGIQQVIDITVDWASVPVLDHLYPDHVNAYYRCSQINPALPQMRKDAIKLVTTRLNAWLTEMGMKRKGNVWTLAFQPAAEPIMEAPIKEHPPGALRQFWNMVKQTRVTALPLLNPYAGHTLYLDLQKSSDGTGFFINTGIAKPRGASFHNPTVFPAIDCTHRFQDFIAHLHPVHRIDAFAYVRLLEDARTQHVFFHVIEFRIVPWLMHCIEMAAKRTAHLSPKDMQYGHPLPYAVGE